MDVPVSELPSLVLCIASSESSHTISTVASRHGLGPVKQANTMQEALDLLLSDEYQGQWALVAAALGTKPGVDLLFDQGEGYTASSSLLQAAKSLEPKPLAVVFSHTAAGQDNWRNFCLAAGADAVVCEEEALSTSVAAFQAQRTLCTRPSQPRLVLCIAGTETTAIVSKAAQRHLLGPVRKAKTMQKAVDMLNEQQSEGGWAVVVAALGTQAGVDLLFDTSEGIAGPSSLLEACKSLQPKPLVVVFSHTACRREHTLRACLDAGADAVVCTAEDLDALVLQQASPGRLAGADELPQAEPVAAADEVLLLEGAEAPAKKEKGMPLFESLEDYPVLARRRKALISLAQEVGQDHPDVQRIQRWLDSVQKKLAQLPRPLTLPETSGDLPFSQRPIRFVHVSDTHHHHDQVATLVGDVLLHTGDFVGNYGKEDVNLHLDDFRQWLHTMSFKFKLVIFIAGNHDTPLDPPTGEAAQRLLSTLPPNVVYLMNSGVEFEGLKIWGSPVVMCRLETEGKRYYSNAFERPKKERTQVWEQVPEGLDLLLTHCPPDQILCETGVGCELLRERLETMEEPPRFHCFGHAHNYFGVRASRKTVFLNGAQEKMIWMRKGKGCGWVFDVPRRVPGSL